MNKKVLFDNIIKSIQDGKISISNSGADLFLDSGKDKICVKPETCLKGKPIYFKKENIYSAIECFFGYNDKGCNSRINNE